MSDTIVFDIETKKSFDDVGGWANMLELGVSLVGVYSYNHDKYRAFREEEFGQLSDVFKNAGTIIGYNSISFDVPILQQVLTGVDLTKINHVDLMVDIANTLGFRLKLDSVAKSTLNIGKSGDGLDAIKYYRAEQWEELAKYCLQDVRVTKELYDYGMSHGQVMFMRGGKAEAIEVPWGKGSTIFQTLTNALRDHQRVAIKYIEEAIGNRSDREIDVRFIDNKQVKCWCHRDQREVVLDVYRIFSARAVGDVASFQTAMF